MSQDLNSLYTEIDRLRAERDALKAELAHEKASYESLAEIYQAAKADWYDQMKQLADEQDHELRCADSYHKKWQEAEARLDALVERIAAKELSRERIFRAKQDDLYFAGRADEALFVHGPLLRALCEKGGSHDSK